MAIPLLGCQSKKSPAIIQPSGFQMLAPDTEGLEKSRGRDVWDPLSGLPTALQVPLKFGRVPCRWGVSQLP